MLPEACQEHTRRIWTHETATPRMSTASPGRGSLSCERVARHLRLPNASGPRRSQVRRGTGGRMIPGRVVRTHLRTKGVATTTSGRFTKAHVKSRLGGLPTPKEQNNTSTTRYRNIHGRIWANHRPIGSHEQDLPRTSKQGSGPSRLPAGSRKRPHIRRSISFVSSNWSACGPHTHKKEEGQGCRNGTNTEVSCEKLSSPKRRNSSCSRNHQGVSTTSFTWIS